MAITEDIEELRAQVLGEPLEDNPHFRSSGSASRRNALIIETKTGAKACTQIITLLLNEISAEADNAVFGVNGFADRFDKVVGYDGNEDKEIFESLGDNLIRVVAGLKQKVDFFGEGWEFVPVPYPEF